MRSQFETTPVQEDASDWPLRARCRGEDPELFFHPDGERNRSRAARTEEAKKICRLCPVQEACREWAIEKGIPYGIWGNMSEKELEIVRSSRYSE